MKTTAKCAGGGGDDVADDGVDEGVGEDSVAGFRVEGQASFEAAERCLVTLFKPTRTSRVMAGGGGRSFLGAQEMTNSRSLRFLSRLPFEGGMWVLRYWPMGERRSMSNSMIVSCFEGDICGHDGSE